jgi:hypothetical protein
MSREHNGERKKKPAAETTAGFTKGYPLARGLSLLRE